MAVLSGFLPFSHSKPETVIIAHHTRAPRHPITITDFPGSRLPASRSPIREIASDKGAVRLIGIVNWPVVARSMIFCRMDVTYALDRYTVFEEQYNAGVELMKSVDLMYQTMLAELPALVRCYASRARP
ncbi:hypothetical protein [Rhizobium leguminosarum]|uniref:hypothetical protein n=1 Tax=Rhizobium leguminosarum TaxID=384 RepID=UPI001FCC4776|nr:hypothetical protein [Rhizobium leguminosarum]